MINTGYHKNLSLDAYDGRQFSSDVHQSLRELNSKENDYILIANKTPSEYRGTNSLAFLQAIPWMAVFDLFDPKTKEDGLYYTLNKTRDSPPVTKKELGDFKHTEEKPTLGTTWVLRSQTMHDSLWIHNSKDCLYRAMSTYHERAPNGRIHCVFLVLSEENLREMADIIDSCVSIIGNNANKCITILSEKKEVGLALKKLLQPDVCKDLKDPCSIFGFPLEFLRESVEEMLGEVAYQDATATTELPFWNGKYKPILNKRINSLTDLEVYFPKPKLSSSIKEVKTARDNFYKGEVIKQLNLDNNDDIERTLATNLTQRIDQSLKRLSTNPDDTTCAEIVSLSYESGSGATTLGRRMLWNKRVVYRCAVVKAITENTDHQIQELQRFGYETGQGYIPPVLILVDNFAEHQVHNLRDKLSGRNTKCVLLSTIPVAIKFEKKSYNDCLKLGKLDRQEIQRVTKILANVEDKNEKEKDAAVEKIKREKSFMWLGLELFGRQYNKIRKRLSDHIHDIISHNVTNQLKGAYEMILRFCCLLDFYSKGRSIYPHPCIADILYALDDLNNNDMNQIEKIHDKFGGLLLEDYSETEGYHGWRPAHFLVGEVVQEEMNFVETAKMLVEKMNSGTAFARSFLINNTVNVFLKREKISESSSQNINDTDFILDGIGGEDEFDSLEVQTRYSALVMAAMPNENFPSNVLNALDLLVTLIENVHASQHKARTWQQIARVFAYEIGMRKISETEISPLVTRVNGELKLSGQSLKCSTVTNGFAIAHQIIDHAIEMQKSFVHYLVTKATFFKVKLRDLYEQAKDFSARNEESKEVMEEAISTTRKGIQAYDNALESPDGYLHAMVGKIQTIIVLLQIFKTHSCFTQSSIGPDESFKNYVTEAIHPATLEETFTKDDLEYFLSLANKVVQHLNEFFGELKVRKRQYEKHEKQELINAKIRAMDLRKTFYQVTQRDRRNERIVHDTGCKEDIVHDLLYEYEETPYSTWMKLPSDVILRIYSSLKNAIPKGPVSHDSMLICARAALEASVTVDDLFQHIQLWIKHHPKSIWCHLFNYMIHFPIPNGTLKSNVQIVKKSAEICKNRGPRIRERYRKSGAEYLLGRGIGLNVILSSHKVSPDSVEHKIAFWRSLELYEKLERLRGEKILGRKGVLSYKGIEIMFDNERYPKESRDELWFCLGFTLNGPYAYDPIDDDTYKEMEEEFQRKKKSDAYQASGTSQELRAEERTLKAACQSDNQEFAMPTEAQVAAHKTISQPSDCESEKLKNKPTKHKAEVTKYTLQYIKEGEFKDNPKLVLRKRAKEGDQKTFKPRWKDTDGKIHHGAFVKNAPKSSECRRHKEGTVCTPSCPFAHSWKGDYVQQTICDLCTKSGRFSCMQKDQHSRHVYVLGCYLKESGEIWLPPKSDASDYSR